MVWLPKVTASGTGYHLKDFTRPKTTFVNSSGSEVVNIIFLAELDVQADFVFFSWNDHAGSIFRMNDRFISNVREVCVGYYVNDAPDVVSLLALHSDAKRFSNPGVGAWLISISRLKQ